MILNFGSFQHILVGGFNPSEKYWSKWESSSNRGENKKYLKPVSAVTIPTKKSVKNHHPKPTTP